MKAKYIIQLLVCSLTSVLVSCSDSLPYSEDAYNNTWIDADPLYISLGEDEFNGQFIVNSSHNWYVYECSPWINVSNNYGYGYDFVSFTVGENDDSSDRGGYITLRTDDAFSKEVTVWVSQAPTVRFEATMYNTNYSASGDWWGLNISAGYYRSWTITKSDSWVHIGSSDNSSYSYSGKGDECVYIYVDRNPYTYSRSSTLTVKCGTKSRNITITQDGSAYNVPFTISSILIGNTDYNGNFINNYGSVIYSYQTRYLTPRLYIDVITPGTYTIYHKLYKPDGTMSTGTNSPTGYTNKKDVTINRNTSYIDMWGWGNNNAGFWGAGQYRWEFWYNGGKIGEKTFTIY